MKMKSLPAYEVSSEIFSLVIRAHIFTEKFLTILGWPDLKEFSESRGFKGRNVRQIEIKAPSSNGKNTARIDCNTVKLQG